MGGSIGPDKIAGLAIGGDLVAGAAYGPDLWFTSTPAAIEYVSSASAQSTTVSMPTHQAGDLLLCMTARTSNTAPTLASGWTNITTANYYSFGAIRVAYKIAGSSSESTGTWTDAARIAVHVYRGAEYRSSATNTGNAAQYPALGSLAATDTIILFGFSTAAASVSWASSGTQRQLINTGTGRLRTADLMPLGSTSFTAANSLASDAYSMVTATIALKLAGT